MNPIVLLILLVLIGFSPQQLIAQDWPDSTEMQESPIYKIIKNDGAEYTGTIIYQDEKEVLLDTEKLGRISIPKHEIKEITLLDSTTNPYGYSGSKNFGSRYFLSANGLPIPRGSSYIQWSLWGPDLQFAVTDNFGLGISTSWLGIPIIGSAKYSIQLPGRMTAGIGTLLATGSWVAPDFGFAMPFGILTYGDSHSNISALAGYGALIIEGDVEGRVLYSVGGLIEVGDKLSLVFDSFIFPSISQTDSIGFALLIPGFRLHFKPESAFQFGFGGMIVDGSTFPLPIPFVQWYRSIN